MPFEPKEWKDEEGPAGLVDAAALIDLEERVTSEAALPDSVANGSDVSAGDNGLVWNAEAGKWESAYVVPAASLLKWDGEPASVGKSLFDIEGNNTDGYLFHLHTGAAMASPAALIGIGVGDGGPTDAKGILLSQKSNSTGDAFRFSNQAGTTGYCFHGEQLSPNKSLVYLEQVAAKETVAKPVLKLWNSQTEPGAGQALTEWGSSLGAAVFGGVIMKMYATGLMDLLGPNTKLRINGGELRVQKEDPTAAGNVSHWLVTGGTEARSTYRRYTGAAGKFYAFQVGTNVNTLELKVGKANNAGGTTEGAEEYVPAIKLATSGASAAQIGFLGAAAASRQAAIASPEATVESLKTAVDALREVVKTFGFTS